MDQDRKSAVSSFYGGRKNSLDALNNDFPSSSGRHYDHQSPPGRSGDDNSFYDSRASRGSVDMLHNGRPNSAGYNSTSFLGGARQEPLKGGRDEEEQMDMPTEGSWDVFADFNNAGPRYSTAFTQNSGPGYHQLPHTPKEDAPSTIGPVEMVTVPALGPEWRADEMRDMTKAGKREKLSEKRREKWKAWNRGERGLCGSWFTRRTLAFFIFGLCAAVAILLAFMIPRVPAFEFNNDTPLLPATGDFNSSIPTLFSRAPVNFSFPAFADLELDTNSNYLPLKFNHISAKVYDLDTSMQVATGNMGSKTVPAKSFPKLQIPLNFTYIATNQTDITWTNWYNACRNKNLNANGTRPGVDFRLDIFFDIAGLIGSRSATTQINNSPCPIELPVNSV